jgi:AcrR family transcriptional regulator
MFALAKAGKIFKKSLIKNNKERIFFIVQVLKAEIRLIILNAAKNLFFEQGFQRATMRQVADHIQMSVSNLYKYFENKDELFNEVVKSYASTFKENFIRELEHRTDEEFEQKRIKSMVKGFSKSINADPKLFYILMEHAQGSTYENFKKECVLILKKHMFSSLSKITDVEFIIDVIVSNLFTAFASIGLKFGGTVMVEKQLEILFDYHMAGYKSIRK